MRQHYDFRVQDSMGKDLQRDLVTREAFNQVLLSAYRMHNSFAEGYSDAKDDALLGLLMLLSKLHGTDVLYETN